MNTYPSRSEETQILAAQQTHDDMHPGHGVIAAPTHEAIARRAYELYVKAGRKQGQCTHNWLQAEHELLRTGHRRP